MTGSGPTPFFSNLLPEGPGKEGLCRQLGISPDNRYEILRAIGHDCAGALTIGDRSAGAEPPNREAFRAHEFALQWGDSPVLERITRIIRTQIRRTRTLLSS